MYKTYRESSTKLWRHLLAIILVPIAIGIVSPAALAESPLMTPRAVPQKPAHTQLTEMDDPRAIVIKFAEGTGARLRFDPSPSLTLRSSQAESLHGVLRAYSLGFANFHRLFDRPEGELDEERQLAQRRSGRLLADLNLYFRVNLPESVNSAQLCDDLNALSFVELARPLQRPAPPPVDIPPKTGDFGSQQVYLYSTVGIGMVDVMSVNGADGSGLTIVDIEYAWVLNHEDLELTPSANIDPSTIYNPFPKKKGSHGTAVLGILGATHNGYGINGISPQATLKVAPQYTVEHGYNIERAISLATGNLRPGDVILLENQVCVCGIRCSSPTNRSYGPSEYLQSVFDATSIATALGIIVVAAAGNGNVDLDSGECGRRFDRTYRDSGAIIVGAGDSMTRSRLGFSTYGSRVDVQGWGNNVVTAGYGDLFNPGDIRQRYTRRFSGTSSASPIVAGAVLSLQGIARAVGMEPLDPRRIRRLLVATGMGQTPNSTQNIGPLPNMPEAVAVLLACLDARYRNSPFCKND